MARPPKADAPTEVLTRVGGRVLSLSNLDKVLFPATGYTKAEVISYYSRIAPVIVPHITDRVIPAGEVFTGMPVRYAVAEVEDFLRANLPGPDPKAELAARIVDRITKAPEIVRVDALAQEFETTVRQLQRLFVEHVGVGPKWVIRRYRLHEVTEQMAGGSKIDWAGLAADLGYADQAHFTRDFTRMFGETPSKYAERY